MITSLIHALGEDRYTEVECCTYRMSASQRLVKVLGWNRMKIKAGKGNPGSHGTCQTASFHQSFGTCQTDSTNLVEPLN